MRRQHVDKPILCRKIHRWNHAKHGGIGPLIQADVLGVEFGKAGSGFYGKIHKPPFEIGKGLHPVGVDIQQCRSFKPNIADRFFHPDEVQYLSSLSPAERENAFYTLWALKESYVKADGRGLRLLRQFCVDIACQPPAITVGAPGSLFVPDFPDPAYRLGVCVQKKDEESPTLTVLPQLFTP